MVALEEDESPPKVCVRSLRTQQRAKSQCTKAQNPVSGAAPSFVRTDLTNGGHDRFRVGRKVVVEALFLSTIRRRKSAVVNRHSTESLILAQDERWRRA